jgi:hypothetical protein
MDIFTSLDMTICSLYMRSSFGGTCHLHHQGRKSVEHETSDQVPRHDLELRMIVDALVRPEYGYPNGSQNSNN